MQRPDAAKRRELLAVGARLFASRPYHLVRLEDVAAEARVSKGTIYTYFAGKEDLFLSILRDGLADLVGRVRTRVEADAGPAAALLEEVIGELVAFCVDQAEIIRIRRQGAVPAAADAATQALGEELRGLLEGVLRRGVAQGALVCDDLAGTPLVIFGAIVEPVTWPGATPDARRLAARVARLVLDGLRPRAAAPRAPARRAVRPRPRRT